MLGRGHLSSENRELVVCHSFWARVNLEMEPYLLFIVVWDLSDFFGLFSSFCDFMDRERSGGSNTALSSHVVGFPRVVHSLT